MAAVCNSAVVAPYGLPVDMELMPNAGLSQSCCNALATRRRPSFHTSMVATFVMMPITVTSLVLGQQQVSSMLMLLLPHTIAFCYGAYSYLPCWLASGGSPVYAVICLVILCLFSYVLIC